MSTAKVNHNVIKPWVDQSVAAKSGSTAGTATSEWLDVNGWTDKRVSYEADVTDGSGSLSLSYEMHISPQHYYELNNKTATTDDYEVITLASAVTAATLASVDAEDVDELQRPFRACRFKASNADASDAATVNLWIEGWS